MVSACLPAVTVLKRSAIGGLTSFAPAGSLSTISVAPTAFRGKRDGRGVQIEEASKPYADASPILRKSGGKTELLVPVKPFGGQESRIVQEFVW